MAVSQATLVRYSRLVNKIYIRIAAALFALALIYSAIHGLSGPPAVSIENREYSECHEYEPHGDSCIDTTSESKANQEETTAESNSSAKPEYLPNKFIQEKRDLNAQEGVWRASNVTARYAFFQSVIGVIGIFLIYFTYKETGKVLDEARKTTHQAALATKAANETLEEARQANVLQLKPYISLKSARMETPFKDENGTFFTGIVLKFVNTGESTAEIVGGWVSEKKLLIFAHGDGRRFEADIISVECKEPSHIYLNPRESFKMMCVFSFEDIPEFIPLKKLCFQLVGSIEFRDISTPGDENWVRHCAFQANRSIREFAQSQRDWKDVELKTECYIAGDRVIESITSQINKGFAKPKYD